MTEQLNEDSGVAPDDSSVDLQSLWDESDDESVLLPGKTAENDELGDEEDDSDEEENTGGGDEEDEGEDDGESDDASDEEEEEDDEEELGDASQVDYKALYERSQHEVKTMAGRLRAAQSTKEPQEEQPTPAKPQAAPEEDEFLAQFREKYSDDVIKAIDLITTRKASQLIETTLQARMNPLEEATNTMVAQAHFAAIEAVHPDLEEIDRSPVFESWIANRPEHLRGTYEQIRSHGTPAQVIAMVNEYKAAIGAQSKGKVASGKTKKAVTAMGVHRQRGTVQTAAKRVTTDLAELWDEIDD